jgi:Leucine-rich repeat (LRR) protein
MRLTIMSVVLFLSAAVAFAADDAEYAASLKTAGNNVTVGKDGRLTAITFRKSEDLRDADYKKLGASENLKQLTFYGNCKMTDAQAEQVGRLTSLDQMAINGTALSDAAFEQLGKLKNLRRLTFWHLGWQKVEITGKGFASLAGCPNLEAFGFGGSTIGDEGLKALTAVKSLKEISAGHTRITDAGLEHLKSLPNLTTVNVSPQFSMRLGDAGLKILASIPTLESINYSETMLTYDGSLKHLKDLKSLKKLTLDKTAIGEADLSKLKADLPNVAIVHTPPDEKMLEQMRKIQDRKKK